jgi:predicted enzyme related to lactoylglutathione lyase
MPRVIHFEIQVDQPERAVGFYKTVFGWKIDQWGGPENYWLITTGDDKEMGINGGMMKRTPMPSPTINTIGVSSVDEFASKITANGGKIIRPKTAIPGVGYFAYCQDTEGNIFGIMQSDDSAK